MKAFTLLDVRIVIDWAENGNIRASVNGNIVYSRCHGAPVHVSDALDAITTALALASQEAQSAREAQAMTRTQYQRDGQRLLFIYEQTYMLYRSLVVLHSSVDPSCWVGAVDGVRQSYQDVARARRNLAAALHSLHSGLQHYSLDATPPPVVD